MRRKANRREKHKFSKSRWQRQKARTYFFPPPPSALPSLGAFPPGQYILFWRLEEKKRRQDGLSASPLLPFSNSPPPRLYDARRASFPPSLRANKITDSTKLGGLTFLVPIMTLFILMALTTGLPCMPPLLDGSRSSYLCWRRGTRVGGGGRGGGWRGGISVKKNPLCTFEGSSCQK